MQNFVAFSEYMNFILFFFWRVTKLFKYQKKNCQNKTYLSLFSSEFHDMFSRFFFVLLHIFLKHKVFIFHTSVRFLVIFTTKLQNQTNQGWNFLKYTNFTAVLLNVNISLVFFPAIFILFFFEVTILTTWKQIEKWLKSVDFYFS